MAPMCTEPNCYIGLPEVPLMGEWFFSFYTRISKVLKFSKSFEQCPTIVDSAG